jgi:hypothetical protein
MIVLDTVDNAYFLLEQHMCKKYNVEYKNDDDLAFGKGTALINAELRRYLLKLSSMGVGIVLTSHTAAAERDTKKGHVTVEHPSLPEKVMPMVLGMVDFIFYCTTDVFKKSADAEPITRHVMYTRPAPTHVAGHRIGNLPEVMPLSYVEFAKAFAAGTKKKEDNKTQPTTTTQPTPITTTTPATQPTSDTNNLNHNPAPEPKE